MSPRLPHISGAEAIRALGRVDWYRHHQRGSHVHLRHLSRAGQVTVAVHAGDILAPKTLQSILDQAGMTVDELSALL